MNVKIQILNNILTFVIWISFELCLPAEGRFGPQAGPLKFSIYYG